MTSKILIVEDERLIALDLKRCLTQLKYEVVGSAYSYETALEVFKSSLPDLVLMDIHLQGKIDGITTAAEIRERFNIPVIFLTAHADDATLAQAKIINPFGYLVKPIQIYSLSMAIEIALTRHHAELGLQAALEKEKELNELKSKFISIVSHEFRNPLAVIQLVLEFFEIDEDIPIEKRHKRLRHANQAMAYMTDLLEQISLSERLKSGQLKGDRTPINLVEFCQEIANDLQSQAEGKNRVITFHFKGNVKDAICAVDLNLLNNILKNLLNNAVKYSLPQGEINFELKSTPGSISFQIQDHGIGIPMEDQLRLFEPFCRGSNVGAIPGIGLGLSIVKQCVDAYDGDITYESAIGKGTTFVFTFLK